MKPPNMKPIAAGMAVISPLIMIASGASTAVIVVGIALLGFAVVLGWQQYEGTRAEALVSVTLGVLATLTVVAWPLLGWKWLLVDVLVAASATRLSTVTFAPRRTIQQLAAAGWGHNRVHYLDEVARDSFALHHPRLFNLDGTSRRPQCPPVGSLDAQWSQLDNNWKVTSSAFSATLVGPPGLVQLFNIAADGITVASKSTRRMGPENTVDADQAVALGATSWREHLTDTFVEGSPAKEALSQFDYGTAGTLEQMNAAVLDAHNQTWAACHNLPDDVHISIPEGDPELPWGPVRASYERAGELGFPADYASPVVYVLHGARMDCAFGRVHIYHDDMWMGQVWVVHPKHVAELLNTLPQVMRTHAQLRAAQAVVSADWEA